MSDITDVLNASTGVSQSQESSATISGGSMGQDEFMKLLVTQLSNQDPLSPMKNEEFVAQLAQFSSLEQLVNVNERLDGLAVAQLSQNGASAVNFIGKDVRAMADWVEVDGENPADLNFELLGNAEDVTVTIKDEDGNVVRSMSLSDMKQGSQSVSWDGKDKNGSPVAAGTYTVNVDAENENGSSVGAYAVAVGRVEGISYENGYPELSIGDHRISLSDIIEVMEE